MTERRARVRPVHSIAQPWVKLSFLKLIKLDALRNLGKVVPGESLFRAVQGAQ